MSKHNPPASQPASCMTLTAVLQARLGSGSREARPLVGLMGIVQPNIVFVVKLSFIYYKVVGTRMIGRKYVHSE